MHPNTIPHIHVVYGEFLGIIDIRDSSDSSMIQGDLQPKALKIVQEWTTLNRDALLKMWETQDIHSLPPIE